MSRWVQEYSQHPFQLSWQQLMTAVESLDVNDKTVVTTVEELARLKKVLNFLQVVIQRLDPELTPRSVWESSHPQIDACLQQVKNYAENHNPGHLNGANEHADNVLTYMRPYMVLPPDALDAYGAGVKKFAEQVTSYLQSFQDTATQSRSKLKEAVSRSADLVGKIEAASGRVGELTDYLFVGSAEVASAESAIKNARLESEEKQTEIAALHKEVLVGPESTSENIKAIAKELTSLRISMREEFSSVSEEVKSLSEFHTRVFGRPPSDDDESREGGLKYELDERLEQLSKLESEQDLRHSALLLRVESLLPGATSAGLASSYKVLKDNFTSPIARYTLAFYASLMALLGGALVLVIDSFTLWPLSIQLVQAKDWDFMLRTLLARAPLVVPIVWLALFSATRRSQYERLQQEYAHKEALASSYESYKKQLQDLKVDADALQRELIAKAIEAIAYNASKTLDGNHTEKLPALQIFEKLSVDEMKKLIDLARGR